MKDKDLFEYAIQSYAFVLPRNGEFTFDFWADEIKKVYDAANVHNSVIINELRKYKDYIITRRNGVSFVENV